MKVDLQVRMELDGIRAVLFDRRAGWAFAARCANCGEAFPQNIHLDPSESVPVPGSRGDAHVVIKCKMCERTGNVKILSSADTVEYADDSAGQFVSIGTFEGRGVDLVSWTPDADAVSASGLSSTAFDSISLDDDWFDYDEKQACPVSITEFQQRFVDAK
ncbi:hypothetical protein PBRA_003449 [Plasmodiophora brassicae]|uniref:Uncharacterized protein n=1 Tax=Plasmodiophora brassicae TaxID=37360 RepID=A0A0G4J8J7_PLABS|nr:hypothetical protein PBRA_003449 [Plasmodiophora brassicae]